MDWKTNRHSTNGAKQFALPHWGFHESFINDKIDWDIFWQAEPDFLFVRNNSGTDGDFPVACVRWWKAGYDKQNLLFLMNCARSPLLLVLSCYQSKLQNFDLVIMNNLLNSAVSL